jgi:uncharacterized protein DUF4865
MTLYAMQYEITLPADYDMGVIHKRVADRGHLTDGFPGLGFKAYLVRTAPINQYAPFYVWNDTAGMNRFLWGGGGFQAIIKDFGRPPVNHWTGVTSLRGPATEARAATRVRASIPFDTDLVDLVAGAALDADVDGLFATVLAIDPFRWEILRFTLWEEVPTGEAGDRYDVLHLSSGQLD